MKTETKTVYEIIQEYLNRLKAPEYEQIGIVSDDNQSFTFNDVRNLRTERDEHGIWLVFDSVWGGIDRHIKIKGYITRYAENTSKRLPRKNITYEKCRKIIILTHSGERETYKNVSNVIEDTGNKIVEFDASMNGEQVHFFKRPGLIEHVEEVLESRKE